MNASVLVDVVWAMVGVDVAIFAGAIGSAMWINRRDNRRNEAAWAAYLAVHPEIRARLGEQGGRQAAAGRVAAARQPVYAGAAEGQVHG